MKKGLFIAVEGMDGSGKSTQVWKIAEHIWHMDKHNHIIITRNPYKNANIRSIVRENDDPYTQGRKLAKLFIEDRRVQVNELIRPNLIRGSHVISDRYAFSTLAYQQTQGISLKELLSMHKGLPIPDIIFLVDVPPETAIKRMHKDQRRKKTKSHRFEENINFMKKLRQNYLDLAKMRKHRVIVVDGKASPEEIFEEQIKPILDKVMNENKDDI